MKIRFQDALRRSVGFRGLVPQGFVLGPNLFVIYVDDLVRNLPLGVRASLYADDLAIWASDHDEKMSSHTARQALVQLRRWSALWRLLSVPPDSGPPSLAITAIRLIHAPAKFAERPLLLPSQPGVFGRHL